jgi:ATP-dependent helicase/nuclease subunit B
MSVTRVEEWLRDPYGTYARYLLRLRKLDEPGLAFGAREMGSLLHKVFERAALDPAPPTRARLDALFDALAPECGLVGAERRFWSAAVAGAFDWFSAFDAERRAKGAVASVEVEGGFALDGVEPPFTLTARADRIDVLHDGRVAIFDYKSGKAPTENQDEIFALQLALTGCVVEAGGFQSIGPRTLAWYEYLRVLHRNGKEDGWRREGDEARAALVNAERELRRWIAQYDDPATPYASQPRAEFVNDYGDYDQLARRKEWAAAEEVDGDGGVA